MEEEKEVKQEVKEEEEIKTLCGFCEKVAVTVAKESVTIWEKIVECTKKNWLKIRELCCIEETASSSEVLSKVEVEEPVATEQPVEQAKEVEEPVTIGQSVEQEKEAVIESKSARKMTFKYYSAKAKEVKLAGVFTNWEPKVMNKKGNGVWHRTFELLPGRYAYKVVVDGKWMKDSKNPKSEPDTYGGESSVVEVK